MSNTFQGHSDEESRRRARQAHRRKVRRNRRIFAVICLLGVLLLVMGIVKGLKKPQQSQQPADSASTEQQTPVSENQETETPTEEPDETDTDTNLSDWRLILVNNNVPLPEDYSVECEVADDSTGKQLQTEAAEAYREMAQAAANDGVQLMLCSGYRTVEYQTSLFDEKKQEYLNKGMTEEEAFNQAKTVVAVPGYSEHNSGLAADIVTPSHQNLDSAYEKTEAFAWLSEHSGEYGFILRYPQDKQAITGIIYEPWHYRYVGPQNVAALKGICLEELYAQN